MATDINENFLKDVLNESKLNEMLESLGDKKPQGLQSEVDLTIKVLNEQTESLVRYRFDVEFWREMEKRDPTNKEHVEKRKEADRILSKLRVTVRIIREHLAKKLGLLNGTEKQN